MNPRVAIVSDTHDKVDPRLKKLFRRASVLVHAGDVTQPTTLDAIHKLVPGATLVAVRGNNDKGPLAELPEVATVDVQGVRLLCAHAAADAEKALADPARARARVVVHGHSHRPSAEVLKGRLWINPGGAGPKRFSLPRSAAVLVVRPVELAVTIHSLDDDALDVIAEARLTTEP